MATLMTELVATLFYPAKKIENTDLTIGQVFCKDDSKQQISVENILQIPINLPPGNYKFRCEVRAKKEKIGMGIWYVSADRIGGQPPQQG